MNYLMCWIDLMDTDDAFEIGLTLPEFVDPELRRHSFSPPRYLEDYEHVRETLLAQNKMDSFTIEQDLVIRFYLLQFYLDGYSQLSKQLQNEYRSWNVPRKVTFNGRSIPYYLRRMYRCQLDLSARMCNIANDLLSDDSFNVLDHMFIVNKMIAIDY